MWMTSITTSYVFIQYLSLASFVQVDLFRNTAALQPMNTLINRTPEQDCYKEIKYVGLDRPNYVIDEDSRESHKYWS